MLTEFRPVAIVRSLGEIVREACLPCRRVADWLWGFRRSEPLPSRPVVAVAVCLAVGCAMVRGVSGLSGVAGTSGVSLAVVCWLATATAVALIAYALYAKSKNLPAAARQATTALLAMALIQPALGIATLLSVVAIPLAALHQAGAVVLLGVLLWTMRTLKLN